MVHETARSVTVDCRFVPFVKGVKVNWKNRLVKNDYVNVRSIMQHVEKCNIWKFHHAGNYIVIPTNIGWKANGANVMGAGLAKQASEMFPDLAMRYGKFCLKQYTRFTRGNPDYVYFYKGRSIFGEGKLVLFPTKPLNRKFPHLSWQNEADIELIMDSAQSLAWKTKYWPTSELGPIYLPRVGCGNGGLNWSDVKPILEDHLDDKFIVADLR